MSDSNPPRPITVGLIGNPNTGKSTLFNALSGLRQRVGNYPGVTVEKKVGRTAIGAREVVLIDLPGTYSLAPRSPDEMVAVDVLLGHRADTEKIDVVLCIVDASNLERNLYLVSQVLELGLPTVIALNMTDVAEEKGIRIDVPALSQRLNLPVVAVQANRKVGLDALRAAVLQAFERGPQSPPSPFPEEFQRAVEALSDPEVWQGGQVPPRFLVERLLLDATGYLAEAGVPGYDERMQQFVLDARGRLAENGYPVPAVEAMSRYQWAAEVLRGIVERVAVSGRRRSDQLDAILTHRVGGLVAFALIMLLMFQSVFWVATPASDGIDAVKGLVAGWLEELLDDGAMRSLLINGVTEGVGGVLVFLPQIFVLFLFIAILEDCGYMARAAFLMDRVMSPLGLSGKSFIPLLSSFACAIPGIMAARVIENRRDRLATILVAPLMSCSARFPVYFLLIQVIQLNLLTREQRPGAALQGLLMFAMYALGIVAALSAVLVFKRTFLRGPTPPFVMELPGYKLPGLWLVLQRMFDRGWEFVRNAGTLIFAVSILVWAAAYYPHNEASVPAELTARVADLESHIGELEAQADAAADPQALAAAQAELADAHHAIEGVLLRQSYLGRAGHWIEPLVRPLGWDWRIGCAVIASFPAREVVIATLSVIYNLGSGEDEQSDSLRDTLASSTWDGSTRPVFTIPAALSLMVFFSLCAQCTSTLVVIRRETGAWRWPAFTFVYMTTLAYLAALVTYQVGSRW